MEHRKLYTLHGKPFEVPVKYSVLKVIGFGAYGLVASAVDSSTKVKYAIKKCKNKSIEAGKKILREAKLLRFMNHENILGLSDFYFSRNEAHEMADAYFVTELLDTDLNTVIRSKHTLTQEHQKYFIYQVLRGLKYMHSASVMHRDIKPANLLVNVNCDLKIADFGLSRQADQDHTSGAGLTDYVVTRWYRPPELLLLNKHYTAALDIWATGCILVELINRRPIFPGRDYLDQLSRIVRAIGSNESFLGVTSFDFLENSEALEFMQRQQTKMRFQTDAEAMNALAPSLDADGKDFLQKMLAFNPNHRLSAGELLKHPFMGVLHDPDDEPTADRPFTWELEEESLSKEQLEQLFLAEAGMTEVKTNSDTLLESETSSDDLLLASETSSDWSPLL